MEHRFKYIWKYYFLKDKRNLGLYKGTWRLQYNHDFTSEIRGTI